MSRRVVAEQTTIEKRLQHLREIGSQFEVGLLIGHIGKDRDFIIAIIPTPEVSATDIALVDASWIGIHASQITRMLPGGICVCGVYVFGVGVNATSLSKLAHDTVVQLNPAIESVLTLSLPSETRKIDCQRVYVGVNGNPRPADFGFQHIASRFRKVSSQLNLQITQWLPDSENLVEEWRNSLKTMKFYITTADNSIISDDDERKMPKNLDLTVFVGDSQKSVGDSGRWTSLSTSINLLAYVHDKSSIGTAAAALREDIMRTLHARFDVLLEVECSALKYTLPARVLAPLLSWRLCDYLMDGESLSDCADRLRTLTGMETDVKMLEEVEKIGDGPVLALPVPVAAHNTKENGSIAMKIVAITVTLASIAIGILKMVDT